MTDANVLLGRIPVEHFPCVFGEDGHQPLDSETVAAQFGQLAQTGDAIGEAARQKLGGRAPLGLARGFDEREHTLGPGQVDTAVKKGALGEFSRLSQLHTVVKYQLQHRLKNQKTTVAVYLDDILPGVGFGRLHEHHQHFIEKFSLLRIVYGTVI